MVGVIFFEITSCYRPAERRGRRTVYQGLHSAAARLFYHIWYRRRRASVAAVPSLFRGNTLCLWSSEHPDTSWLHLDFYFATAMSRSYFADYNFIVNLLSWHTQTTVGWVIEVSGLFLWCMTHRGDNSLRECLPRFCRWGLMNNAIRLNTFPIGWIIVAKSHYCLIMVNNFVQRGCISIFWSIYVASYKKQLYVNASAISEYILPAKLIWCNLHSDEVIDFD